MACVWETASKERDAETALDYFGARYFSSAQGRFTSPDEFPGGIVDPFTGQQVSQLGPLPYADIFDPQILNKYGYIRNNPLRHVIGRVVALVILLIISGCSKQDSGPSAGAWIRNDASWVAPPKEINPRLQSAPAAILYFGADHTFSLIYARVNRVPKEYEVISNGDGQEIYLGTWTTNGVNIDLKFRLVERTVRSPGENLPGPALAETAQLKAAGIVFRGHSFSRDAELDSSVTEFVSAAKGR